MNVISIECQLNVWNDKKKFFFWKKKVIFDFDWMFEIYKEIKKFEVSSTLLYIGVFSIQIEMLIETVNSQIAYILCHKQFHICFSEKISK